LMTTPATAKAALTPGSFLGRGKQSNPSQIVVQQNVAKSYRPDNFNRTDGTAVFKSPVAAAKSSRFQSWI
jgi:hypothetical protein